MLGMKNHFDISGGIEIREVDITGVACNSILQVETFQKQILFLQKNLLFIRRIICAISDIYIYVHKISMIQRIHGLVKLVNICSLNTGQSFLILTFVFLHVSSSFV